MKEYQVLTREGTLILSFKCFDEKIEKQLLKSFKKNKRLSIKEKQ